jgi:hypothetical protein
MEHVRQTLLSLNISQLMFSSQENFATQIVPSMTVASVIESVWQTDVTGLLQENHV